MKGDSQELIANKQTRLFPVWLAIAGNIVSSVGIVMTNKALFTHHRFDYGTSLTVIHFAVTAMALLLFRSLGLFEHRSIPMWKILPLSLSFCGFVLLTNLSLQLNSVGLYQMAKVLTTPCVVLLQYLLHHQRVSYPIQASLVICCAGVVIATVSEVHLRALGVLVAAMAVVITSLYQIWVGSEQRALDVNALQLLAHQAPLSAALLATLIPLFDRQVFRLHWSPSLLGMIALSSTFAVGVNVSSFLIIGHTSALTYNVVGHSKLCLILLGGYVFFDGLLNLWNLFGVCLAFLGILLYTILRSRE